MNKRISLIVIGLIAVIGGIAAIALSNNNTHKMTKSASTSSSSSATPSSKQAVTTNSVAIKDYLFDPMPVKVKVN